MNKEGDLYKIIKVFDQEFEIKYGYYEELDRYSIFNEPIPIYPNFFKEPRYTKEGFPFVTHMQDKCIFYKGKENGDSCYNCLNFKKVEDLIGICKCEFKNKLL